jgi:hypothetical protein
VPEEFSELFPFSAGAQKFKYLRVPRAKAKKNLIGEGPIVDIVNKDIEDFLQLKHQRSIPKDK